MTPIFLIGASGHAKVVIDAVEREGRMKIIGVVDPALEPGQSVLGHPRLAGTDDEIPELMRSHGVHSVLIAIGDNWRRYRIAQWLKDRVPETRFETCIHPSACIGRDVSIGAGTVVLAGAVLNIEARVGEHCLINTLASLDHNSTMGDGSSLAPGATVGGNTQIGAFSAVALGAKVLHNVEIGNHCVVGAGAVVISDVPDRQVLVGVPARSVRTREPGDRYL
jgi:sugar O-acyltransferase (sialic acid O-acetyltransferase NeuD family)